MISLELLLSLGCLDHYQHPPRVVPLTGMGCRLRVFTVIRGADETWKWAADELSLP